MAQGSVGEHLLEVLSVARALRGASERRLRVRFITDPDGDPGLLVSASVAARTNAELEAQEGKGRRFIPMAELDARAAELPGLVRSAVLEVQSAVAAAPATAPRPSASFKDEAKFEALMAEAYKRFSGAAREITDGADIPRGAALEAVVAGAMRFAVVAGMVGGLDRSDLHDLVKEAISELSAGSELARATYRLDS